MPTRHRIPSIFNLSMVDVLCCALGCVILLWLLNLREAKQRAVAVGHTSEQLAKTRAQLEETEQRLRESLDLGRSTGIALDRAKADRARTAADLGKTQVQLSEVEQTLASVSRRAASAEDRLAKKLKEKAELNRELMAARQRVASLDILVREKAVEARTAVRGAEELAERLIDLNARLQRAQAEAELVPALRDEARANREKMVGADSRVLNLQDEVKGLRRQVDRVKAEADNRFAGIALTGRRVVFLVDMSGSMEQVDEKTASPEKWSGVRQTLAKIMRSLPELEKYQVILFSTKVSYPLGNGDRWLDYDSVTSTSQVAQALAGVKPEGNTDMYAALEEAFRFQPVGLDTIYLLSDGLPNRGVGVSQRELETLKETELSEKLAAHIRQMLKSRWNPKSANRPQIRINTIGFFYESPDVGAFLWALARENDGSFVGMSKP